MVVKGRDKVGVFGPSALESARKRVLHHNPLPASKVENNAMQITAFWEAFVARGG